MWRPGRDDGSVFCCHCSRCGRVDDESDNDGCGRGDDDSDNGGDGGRFIPVAAAIITVKTTATMAEAFAIIAVVVAATTTTRGDDDNNGGGDGMCEAGRRWHATMATDRPVVPPCM